MPTGKYPRKPLSPEHREKIRQALKGRVFGYKFQKGHQPSVETRQKLSAVQTGRSLSPDHHAKLIGRSLSPEHRAKISAAKRDKPSGRKGQTLSEAWRKALSDAHKGKPLTAETKQKLRAGMLGKPKSPEHREKIAQANRLPKKRRPTVPNAMTRLKLSLASSGANNWNWKGGVTRFNDQLRNNHTYNKWRAAVLQRDGHRCVLCGLAKGWNEEQQKKIILDADHIQPFALFPALRYELSNGRTLCRPCHHQTGTWGARPMYRKHNLKKGPTP